MPHHFTKNTVSAEAFCPTCNRMTQHYVWDGRLGRCMNEHPHPETKRTEAAQPSLFDERGI